MTRTAFDGRTWENHIQKNVRWHWYGVWLGIGPKPLGILALGCPATSWLLVAFPEILAKLGFIIPYNHAETTTAVSPKRSSDASSMLNIVKPHLFVTNSSILQPEISDFFRHDGHPDQSHQSPSLGTPFGCGTSSRWRWTCWTATETWRAMKIWKKVVKKA